MPILLPPADPDRLTLTTVRHQMRLLIETALAPKAPRMHEVWKLRLDLGKNTTLLIPEGSDKINAWMIGTSQILTVVNANGDFEYIGNSAARRRNVFSVWGFYDYALKDPDTNMSSQETAEIDAERIADVFKFNRDHMGFDARPAQLNKVGPFQIDNIDNHDFSDGMSLVIAQCSIEIFLRR